MQCVEVGPLNEFIDYHRGAHICNDFKIHRHHYYIV
jgi:hypothetical protein